MVETPNGIRLRRNRAHLPEFVASPAKTVRFNDEPALPMQIVQQHVSDQPDTVDEADSLQLVQSEKGETINSVCRKHSIRTSCPSSAASTME